MEVNAALGIQNAFTRWAAETGAPVWLAPVASRRGTEVGLVVAGQGEGLDAAIQAAAGPDCRHTVERVSRQGPRVCLRYRCSRGGAQGCGLVGTLLDAVRPVLGTHGFVQSIRFDRDGGQARMLWPPGGPDEVRQVRALLESNEADLSGVGFRLLDMRDATTGLLEASSGAPHLRGAELETLLVAMRYGYYESPRQCTMEDIAGHFGLSKSAIYHRMHAAEREAVRQLATHAALLERRPASDATEPPAR